VAMLPTVRLHVIQNGDSVKIAFGAGATKAHSPFSTEVSSCVIKINFVTLKYVS